MSISYDDSHYRTKEPFYLPSSKDGFGIKQPTNFGMPLNKETKPIYIYIYIYISIIHPRCIKKVYSDATVFIADFGLFLHHIRSDSNPGMTLEEPSRLRDRDVLRSCLYQSKEKKCIYICIYIYNHHHYHVVPLARISLTLSHHFSLSFIASGRSLGLHPVSSHSCCMYVRAGRPAFARPYVGVHRSTSLMSSP